MLIPFEGKIHLSGVHSLAKRVFIRELHKGYQNWSPDSNSHCTDGVSAEHLVSVIGNKILTKHPAKLIQAISDEKRTDMYDIVEQENTEWFAIECQTLNAGMTDRNILL